MSFPIVQGSQRYYLLPSLIELISYEQKQWILPVHHHQLLTGIISEQHISLYSCVVYYDSLGEKLLHREIMVLVWPISFNVLSNVSIYWPMK